MCRVCIHSSGFGVVGVKVVTISNESYNLRGLSVFVTLWITFMCCCCPILTIISSLVVVFICFEIKRSRDLIGSNEVLWWWWWYICINSITVRVHRCFSGVCHFFETIQNNAVIVEKIKDAIKTKMFVRCVFM